MAHPGNATFSNQNDSDNRSLRYAHVLIVPQQHPDFGNVVLEKRGFRHLAGRNALIIECHHIGKSTTECFARCVDPRFKFAPTLQRVALFSPVDGELLLHQMLLPSRNGYYWVHSAAYSKLCCSLPATQSTKRL
jgi:hypothetical protein